MPTSIDEVALLKRFRSTVLSKNKQLSSTFYNKLMKCTSLPTYIINGIDWYFRYTKVGGTNTQLFKRIYPPGLFDESVQITLPPRNMLGQGANGIVYSSHDNPNEVMKLMKVKASLSDSIRKHLIEVFKIVGTDVYNTLYYKQGTQFLQAIPESPGYIPAAPVSNSQSRFMFAQQYPTTSDANNFIMLGSRNQEKEDTIVYSMRKMSGMSQYPYNRNFFKKLVVISFEKIETMHNKNIIHCDLKLDNVMHNVSDTDIIDGQKISLAKLVHHLKLTLTIVDYDGCILLNKSNMYDSLRQAKDHGSTLHAITPLFAHPYLLQFLYGAGGGIEIGNAEKANDKLFREISLWRDLLLNLKQQNILNHDEYHFEVFGEKTITGEDTYKTLFPDLERNNVDQVIKCLKYADYYTMAMSILFIALLKETKEENGKDIVKFVMDHLRQKAQELRLVPERGDAAAVTGGYGTLPKCAKQLNKNKSIMARPIYNSDDNKIITNVSPSCNREMNSVNSMKGIMHNLKKKSDVYDVVCLKYSDVLYTSIGHQDAKDDIYIDDLQ